MTTIADMKLAVKAMMATKYAGLGTVAKATDDQIEAAFFLRKKDAEVIRVVCKGGISGSGAKYSISFRTAGEHTLARIKNGNPCKGHTILTKSIKRKDSAFTYTGLALTDYEKLKGLVGYPISDTDGALAGVWSISGKNGQSKERKSIALSSTNLKTYFTGDYDMHDLLKTSGGSTNRILGGTPDEESAIEAFNNEILTADPTRKAAVLASLDHSTSVRLRRSQYALIRHGAQTSFMSYLLGSGGAEMPLNNTTSLPLENAVTNIDPNVCLFDAAGDAYIFNDIASIYKYYATNSLLDQIPFYYFFKDLRSVPANVAILNRYATEINDYIRGCAYREV